jgi:hypothetical protein
VELEHKGEMMDPSQAASDGEKREQVALRPLTRRSRDGQLYVRDTKVNQQISSALEIASDDRRSRLCQLSKADARVSKLVRFSLIGRDKVAFHGATFGPLHGFQNRRSYPGFRTAKIEKATS